LFFSHHEMQIRDSNGFSPSCNSKRSPIKVKLWKLVVTYTPCMMFKTILGSNVQCFICSCSHKNWIVFFPSRTSKKCFYSYLFYFSFLFFCRKRFFQTLEDQFSVIGLAAQESGENCNK
jgi:hypothetical protein